MKLKTFLICIYCAAVGFFSPEALSIIYVCLTGTAKGKGVSLGSERSLYTLFGLIFLFIFLCILFPIIRAVIKAVKEKKKLSSLLYLCSFILFGAIKVFYVYFIY